MKPSRRAEAIRPSATLELAARAGEMKAAGEDVLNLSAGEPDFDTPAPVVEAAHRALDEGHFRYTPAAGIRPLREKIAEKYRRQLGLDVGFDQVVVSHGAKQALYNAMATATDPGDRVGILRPYWVTYVEQAHALGCEPVLVDCPAATRFRPDLDQLRREVERGLKLLILNSPCNPTGAAYTAEEITAILALVGDSDTLIVSDEIYEDILFDGRRHASVLEGRGDWMERCCLVSGLSKSFAMTGWRIGYSIAPRSWTRGMSALQGHVSSGINAVTQQAALTALERQDLVEPMRRSFETRRDRLVEGMTSIPGLDVRSPEGTFYLYLAVGDHLGPTGRAPDVDALATRLLEETGVVMVPGSAFGDPGHLRLSFAASDEDLDRAVERLARFFR